MAGIVPVFVLLDGASIYTLLGLAFDLVGLLLWGGVRTPSYHRPSKLCFEIEVHLDQFFARQGWGQHLKTLVVFLDELTQTRVKVHALWFVRKILLSVEVAHPFLLFIHAPHSFRGQLILQVLVTLLGIVKGLYHGCFRFRESHLLIILLGPCRGFHGPFEEVQAGPSVNTLSLSPQTC